MNPAYTHIQVGAMVCPISELPLADYYECQRHWLPTQAVKPGSPVPVCLKCGQPTERAPITLLTDQHVSRMRLMRPADEPLAVPAGGGS